MKLISLFAQLALAGIATLVLGFAFDVQALGLFAFAIATLFLLVVAGDYAPLLHHPVAADENVLAFPPQHRPAAPETLAA